MKIVLIGGWGYIGLNLIKQLGDHEIVVIDPHEPAEAEYEFLSEQIGNITHICEEFGPSNFGFLHDADVVVSLPGQLGSVASLENFTRDSQLSIAPHELLLDVLKTNGLTPLVVFPSTDLAYSYQPLCKYTANKLYIENLLRIAHTVWGIPYIALRMATGYGPMQRRNSVINFFVQRGLEDGEIPIWGEGLNRQAFIYADDMARAFEMACQGMFPIGVYPLVGGNYSMVQIAGATKELVGGRVVCEPFPELARLVNVGDLPIYGNPPNFKAEIGLEEGILKTAEWMKGEGIERFNEQ